MSRNVCPNIFNIIFLVSSSMIRKLVRSLKKRFINTVKMTK
ncbi:hypothetical protein P689_122169 [Candidatus Riesia pediculischaeffi PTSU]|uniref:Uncharacterized protein n=1 Tax=Candidatus Riesia pediculischaeffi PTSU TaxID=1401651 RepID=A0A0C1VJH3_9ENTR|nr:hypothetical protein P689_122169 [Candidatus Riesia pediculischaeffi PTSU]